MPRVQARVSTLHASRYLQQLCKHWSHKFAVSFDPSRGVVHLPSADLRLAARDGVLEAVLESEDAAGLPRLCDVVADHLRRFAFREELSFDWVAVPANDVSAG